LFYCAVEIRLKHRQRKKWFFPVSANLMLGTKTIKAQGKKSVAYNGSKRQECVVFLLL